MARLGAIAEGDTLAGARVLAIERRAPDAQITVGLADGAQIVFALGSQRGPFAALPALSYRATRVPFAAFAAVGAALAGALVGVWPLALPSWREAIDELGDDPRRTLALASLLPSDPLAQPACIAPWTRLEYGQADQYGPCCSDFQTAPARGSLDPMSRWRAPAMRAFRRALASPGAPSTCRATCPRLIGRSDTLAGLVVRGGPPGFRANQIAVIDAILAGDDDPPATPLEVIFPATSYCNYDCLMCRFGVDGTLADELPDRFYDSLAPLLPGLGRLEALGGEPLASPVLRGVLAGPLWRAHPQLEVALTTNGSYLTPRELDRYRDVHFAHVTISLNAASAEIYAKINRGRPWARIRDHLDALLARRRVVGNPASVTYSLVILRDNLHELRAFAELAEADDVAVRFMLPMLDRNQQSILTDEPSMRAAADALGSIAARLRVRGKPTEAARVDGELGVLTARLERRIFRPLPDDLVPLRR